jgi:hypothetical protein
MECIVLAQDRGQWKSLVNAIMNLWIPRNAGKLSSGYTISGLSSSAQLYGVSFVNTNGRTSPIRGAGIDTVC